MANAKLAWINLDFATLDAKTRTMVNAAITSHEDLIAHVSAHYAKPLPVTHEVKTAFGKRRGEWSLAVAPTTIAKAKASNAVDASSLILEV